MIESFPFVADRHARILILGSMPGVASLRQQAYYAHPRNAFWPIMGSLFGFDAGRPYEERLARLRRRHIALWDVAHRCRRAGSLDSAIDHASVEANDFDTFLRRHTGIRHIFFNGRKAEEMFRRLVTPHLDTVPDRHLLPSTSPAHAALPFEEKLARWRKIREMLEQG